MMTNILYSSASNEEIHPLIQSEEFGYITTVFYSKKSAVTLLFEWAFILINLKSPLNFLE